MPPPPPPVPNASLAPGRRFADRFVVTALLGRGGSAEIYAARDERSGRDIVVKVPTPECLRQTTERARFRREVEFLRTLAHAHIVPILDAGEEDGVVFAVLARLDGGSLVGRRTQLGTGSPARGPASDLRTWLPGIASALDFIHGQRVFHRDLKPANILFDRDGTAFLADFGLAKSLWGDTSLTRTGFAVGTPEYLAPEQVRDEPPTAAADQYALGTIVFEWLAGTLPFPSASLGRLLWLKAAEETPSLRSVAPDVPDALCAAVERATRRDPRGRFPGCAAFAEAVIAAC